jgi:hypothetical protein
VESKQDENVSTNEDSSDSKELKQWQVEKDLRTETRRRNMRDVERRKMFTALCQDIEPTVQAPVPALV